tara:strand:+ start:1702 stop:1962 length:261 start_codon:yes stop_codon:yes gene_type:complete
MELEDKFVIEKDPNGNEFIRVHEGPHLTELTLDDLVRLDYLAKNTLSSNVVIYSSKTPLPAPMLVVRKNGVETLTVKHYYRNKGIN